MKYISLFTGIGGFEIAIHRLFPDAECVGFSEVDKFAIQVYSSHFPDHKNLGDITTIQKETIQDLARQGIDLLVGGFPCQNLSSLARLCDSNAKGLDGPKSGLFWNMLSVIRWIIEVNPRKLHILIENNGSMKKVYRDQITEELTNSGLGMIYISNINSSLFGVQKRNRLYWTNFKVENIDEICCTQTWNDILEPIDQCCYLYNNIKNGNVLYATNKIVDCYIMCRNDKNLYWYDVHKDNHISKWQRGFHKDTINPKCSPFIKSLCFDNVLVDRRCRGEYFVCRDFMPVEVERLFFIPDGWVSNICSRTRTYRLLGNTVVVKVIEFILGQLDIK